MLSETATGHVEDWLSHLWRWTGRASYASNRGSPWLDDEGVSKCSLHMGLIPPCTMLTAITNTHATPHGFCSQFLQGLGLAQSMPGPLFNFSSYLGAVYKGIAGGMVAYVGLFGPGVILIFGMVPFWARLRHVKWFKSVLNGVNATAIGLVGAACVILWEGAVSTAADAMVFVFAGVLCIIYNIGAPYTVLAGGILGAILHEDALGLGQRSWCDITQGGEL